MKTLSPQAHQMARVRPRAKWQSCRAREPRGCWKIWYVTSCLPHGNPLTEAPPCSLSRRTGTFLAPDFLTEASNRAKRPTVLNRGNHSTASGVNMKLPCARLVFLRTENPRMLLRGKWYHSIISSYDPISLKNQAGFLGLRVGGSGT